jgi:hypothetical protein
VCREALGVAMTLHEHFTSSSPDSMRFGHLTAGLRSPKSDALRATPELAGIWVHMVPGPPCRTMT